MSDVPAVSESLPAPALELRDFPDRLPAVLVKELRQGLRARLFVIPFACLHLLLVFSSLESGRGGSGFFWHCLIIMLIALLPMRNVGALSEERQARTLETLLLTSLTPWRIVSGKWAATFALTLLTAVSAFPYLLVRYLNGGSSFVQEGALLAGLVFLSGAITGILTALSTLGSGMVRHFFALLVILLTYRFGALALLFIQTEDAGAATGLVAILITASVWVACFSLWQAASTIAPASANLATPRRLTTIAALAAAGLVVALCPEARRAGRMVLLFILIVSSLVEMSRYQGWNPGAAAVFGRRGLAGRLAALFLYPGWATGVAFSGVLWLVVMGIIGWHSSEWIRDFAHGAALCFFAVCIAVPFFLRGFSGMPLMVLILLTTQVMVSLALSLLPGADVMVRFIPAGAARSFAPALALGWGAAAFLCALGPLVVLGRRISRESSL